MSMNLVWLITFVVIGVTFWCISMFVTLGMNLFAGMIISSVMSGVYFHRWEEDKKQVQEGGE